LSLRRAVSSLRGRIIVYLVLLHLVLGAIAWLSLRGQPLYLLGIEVLFAASIAIGVLLVRAFFLPLELIQTGALLIRERDFTSQFLPVGSPEMDSLIAVYNEMINRLREERLQREEEHHFLDLILSASPAGILTLDYDGRVSNANPSAVRLLDLPADAVGRPLADLPALAPLAQLPAGGSQVLALPRIGGRRRVKIARAEFFDRGFARSFYVVEELTEELRSSEKAAYEKLIRMMSHEVNNSVGAVGSLLDSFRGYGAALDPDDRDDFLEALTVAATRLDHLRAFMNGFAEVVRLPPPDLRPHDVRQLVEEVLLLLKPELQTRRIRWDWAPEPPALPPVALDRNQMEQVLVNVLKNAMESIGEDGRITLRLSREERATVLAIRDTGAGIAPSIQADLFTPFFSTKRNGRGLGLTLVQEILAQHGFDFRLEGRVGEGAEFTVVMGEPGR
jgi:nitrogen fixation/metabolism regulation signal transduction histidine kinase